MIKELNLIIEYDEPWHNAKHWLKRDAQKKIPIMIIMVYHISGLKKKYGNWIKKK